MKKILSFLCVFLTAALLLPVTAAAAQEPDPAADVYAVVSLTDGGALVVDEAPGPVLMQASESYDLYVEDEPVLSVDHLLAGVDGTVQAPQHYSVDFTLPDSAIEVFLTGLREENVAEIQQRIIAGYAAGASFDLTDLGFVDAEKTFNIDGDDDLCWAASAADMLAYTGWAAQAGYENEDDVFETMISAYENAGGHQFYAAAWFFNGCALNDNSGAAGARILGYPNSGRYLNDYAFDRHTVEDNNLTLGDMDKVTALLRDGYAVGMGTYVWYSDSTGSDPDGGHAITLWGYAVDNSLPAGDPARYLSIFVTDSDSDELMNADRRDAPNVLNVYPIEAYGDYYYFAFDARCTAQIFDYVALAPFSADLPKETDPAASKDKTSYPDLSVGEMYLSDNDWVEEQKTLFESGSTLNFRYKINNYGDAVYQGYLYFQAVLTDADDNVLFTQTMTYSIASFRPLSSVKPSFYTVENLPAGDYTLTFTINPDHSATNAKAEAFYYNNTSTLAFRVRDSYLTGDFDGNGEIDILDATLIQRYLAGFSTHSDENGPLRGDTDDTGLSILDATLVQRHLAGFTSHVGTKKLYP